MNIQIKKCVRAMGWPGPKRAGSNRAGPNWVRPDRLIYFFNSYFYGAAQTFFRSFGPVYWARPISMTLIALHPKVPKKLHYTHKFIVTNSSSVNPTSGSRPGGSSGI